MTAPLFSFNRHREDIQREVAERACASLAHFGSAQPPRSLQLVLNDAAFHEIGRLEKTGDHPNQLARWKGIARRLGNLDESGLKQEIDKLARFYAADIVGNFDPRVYRFASSMLPVGLGAIFNTGEIASGLGALKDLSRRIRIEGDLEKLRGLAEMGTFVVVPTHSSNLDSIVLGWSLVEAGLPPCTYGAGKNLFTNPLVSFFMRNLGAYRVDRRLRHSLYKRVLTTYSQVLLERGYHSLFFPGGTRARSGKVETKLKLGLMGSALSAYFERRLRGDERPVFIVPVTINYPLVLEAETLIDDHLRESGRARYIIEDDEFSRIGRVAHYALKVMALESTMVIRYTDPLDVFGNPVDMHGQSLGPDGTQIDPSRYLYRDRQLVRDVERDGEYTRQLGRAVADAFQRGTVVLPTHFLAWLLFERERRAAPELDLFALLRTTNEEGHPLPALLLDAERLRDRLVALELDGQLHVDPLVRFESMSRIIDTAISTFGMYHARSAVERRDTALLVREPKLIYYYANRLDGHAEKLRTVI